MTRIRISGREANFGPVYTRPDQFESVSKMIRLPFTRDSQNNSDPNYNETFSK